MMRFTLFLGALALAACSGPNVTPGPGTTGASGQNAQGTDVPPRLVVGEFSRQGILRNGKRWPPQPRNDR